VSWILIDGADDFDARSPDELTLRKTDRIELVELDDGFGDGWYLGRHLGRGGGTGLFPGGRESTSGFIFAANLSAVYTAKLPPHALGSNTIHSGPRSPLASPPLQVPSQLSPATPEGPSDRSTNQPSPGTNQTGPTSVPGIPTIYHPHLPHENAKNTSASPSAYIPGVQRSIGQTLGNAHTEQDSPVMNETLSVIDEHITDLSTPRQSLAPPQSLMEDSESEYSSSQLDPVSYIAGPETDDEESRRPEAAEVMQWNAKETADYLRNLGVDPKHCDIFEEQEITGDVLLEMDQSFIYMKEYDFGVMGRRLKTWHKIRDFQNEVRGPKARRKSSLNREGAGSLEDIPRSHHRMASGATILPRIPSLLEKPGLNIRQSQQSHVSGNEASMPRPLHTPPPLGSLSRGSVGGSTPPSPWRVSVAAESPSRPSAAFVREMSHSRRHSSIDVGKQPSRDLGPGSSSVAATGRTSPHQKQPSLDRDWSLSTATIASMNTTIESAKSSTIKKQESLDMSTPGSSYLADSSAVELDRGYFSGNEVDNRKARKVLRKGATSSKSPAHSRKSSTLEDSIQIAAVTKRHSRLSSLDSIKDRGPQITSAAARAYHSRTYKGRLRSASARSPGSQPYSGALSPTVTNLENDSTSALASPQATSGTSSPIPGVLGIVSMPQKALKLMGLRTASDAVTGTEKEMASTRAITGSPLKESPAESPSGSQTPSATSRSFEMDHADTKGADQIHHLLTTKISSRARGKPKQQTSAYRRGLLKISPEEARKNCDYHGWMKKKSSSLITTWKPRLFILRGRRLSYYYSDADTEERGIIDISGHKVLVANSDPITALHATITGAASTASGSGAPSGESSPKTTRGSTSSSPFYFKLVPPKAGMSRAVQFTKPTIHYFQVDSIAEGRKWMGEIMKATIEHDLSTFETTNRQKTISLTKARARKERPPALKGTEDVVVADKEEEDTKNQAVSRESGLNIHGLEFSESDLDLKLGSGQSDGTNMSLAADTTAETTADKND